MTKSDLLHYISDVYHYYTIHLYNIINKAMSTQCSFCSEPNVIHCMNLSLAHKYTEQDDKHTIIIDYLLSKEHSPTYFDFVEVIVGSDAQEHLTHYSLDRQYKRQMKKLLEYYKFRIFVPSFAKSRSSDTVVSYYYSKLKNYYNAIKRRLNITIDPSSSSQNDSASLSETNLSTKEDLLKDIKQEIQLETKKKYLPCIKQYKSQSKALEDLVSYMKLNSHFDHVQTLKTEDCFAEQSIFEETTFLKKNIFVNQTGKIRIKQRLFKKIIQNSQGKANVLQTVKNKQKSNSRSRSIKIIKVKDNKNNKEERQMILDVIKFTSPFRIKQPEKVKDCRNTSSLGKRYSSLGKLPINYSPYKRRVTSQEKPKVTTEGTNIKSTVETIKIKHYDTNTKTKQSFVKLQTIKFQNDQLKHKTSPNSPSNRKTTKQNIEINKDDNILSIRKKKLQVLRQRTSKK